MIFSNKKALKNLKIFSNGSCLINYLTFSSTLNIVFLEKDLKLIERFKKKKSFKNINVLDVSSKYRKNFLTK